MSGQAPWVVHKFGGSSVADAACFERVANIVEALEGVRVAVVLSACRGVTDALYALVAHAEVQEDLSAAFAALRTRHAEIAEALLSGDAAQRYLDAFDNDLRDIERVLYAVRVTRSAAEGVRDVVAGYGELWSSKLLARYLKQRKRREIEPRWVDAREVVIVEWGALGPSVDWERSREALRRNVPEDFGGDLVITGFIASDKQGAQTTLGRNGSDFSASIFAALLQAREICIWTDVDGVLSADPRRVPSATVIDSLSYNEAMELAYFGAKVLHPQTMAPAVSAGIPIWIRNTFAPERAGTLVCASPESTLPVKGITSIEQIALIDLEGAGMIGVPGTARRLFDALSEAAVSVILISQGSSEHSICCAVPEAQADRAAAAVRDAFERELRSGQIHSVDVARDMAILAVVGNGMAGTPGVAAKLFSGLGAANVNVRAIAQGASERNISVVVNAADTTRALRAAHAGFYLSPHTLSIGVIGPGTVGGVFLDQVASQRQRLKDQFNIDLRVRGIASSKAMLLADRSVDLADWRSDRERNSVAADLDRFIDHIDAEHLPHSVLIDCSSSEIVAGRYADLLARGVHIVTPNKKANSGSFAYYQRIRDARRASGAHYFYETTVGAGLPVIQTARDLRETGDDIVAIEGIFSGTLAYLFNVYDGEKPFSEVVREARERGYTEPDPRDDLSGLDVARKLIILAREMGLALELSDVNVESLAPPALDGLPTEQFMRRLPEFDGAMRQRLEAARDRGKVIRHIGRVGADGIASVGLQELDRTTSLANTALTDNIVRYSTRRYRDNPLIVQGPGAGPEVTAGGVFADLLRLASHLGARM